MARTHWAAMAALAGLLSTQAWAEPVDLTGTGGSPATAAKAPYTTATGATVPRPGALEAERNGDLDRTTRRDAVNDKVIQGICIGCGPK